MKWLLSIVLALAVQVSFAQVKQSGVPAKLWVTGSQNGVPVFLQNVEDGKLVFQLYRKPTDRSGPLSRIGKVEFLAKLDVPAVVELFNAGKYQELVGKIDADLESKTDQYWPFMAVENNFQNAFVMLMEASFRVGDTNRAALAADAVSRSGDSAIAVRGRAVQIQLLLADGRIEEAEALLEAVESPAGKLYLKACVEQAREEYQAALWIVTDLIRQYANNLDWLPRAELFAARLYRNLAEDAPETYMESAINTARQVKNIYPGSNSAAEAEKLQAELIEEQERVAAEQKAREEEEAQHSAEIRKRRKERARQAMGEDEPVETVTEGSGQGEATVQDEPAAEE